MESHLTTIQRTLSAHWHTFATWFSTSAQELRSLAEHFSVNWDTFKGFDYNNISVDLNGRMSELQFQARSYWGMVTDGVGQMPPDIALIAFCILAWVLFVVILLQQSVRSERHLEPKTKGAAKRSAPRRKASRKIAKVEKVEEEEEKSDGSSSHKTPAGNLSSSTKKIGKKASPVGQSSSAALSRTRSGRLIKKPAF